MLALALVDISRNVQRNFCNNLYLTSMVMFPILSQCVKAYAIALGRLCVKREEYVG